MTASRRAAALIIALAALVLVLAALGASLRALSAAQQEAMLATTQVRLHDGLRAGERLLQAWIAAHADALVLPPAGGGVLVVDDRWRLPDGEGGVSVVAYDGLGGVPAHLASPGAALRLALPDGFGGLIMPAALPPPGGVNDLLERLAPPAGVRRFPPPPPPGSATRWWLAAGAAPSAGAAPTVAAATLPPPPDGRPALAAALSPHSDGRINVNTAPLAVVAAALRQIGKDLPDLAGRRGQGRFSEVDLADASGLRLVARSDCWNALITVSWQRARRSWWVVATGNPGQLRIVQRHDAGH